MRRFAEVPGDKICAIEIFGELRAIQNSACNIYTDTIVENDAAPQHIAKLFVRSGNIQCVSVRKCYSRTVATLDACVQACHGSAGILNPYWYIKNRTGAFAARRPIELLVFCANIGPIELSCCSQRQESVVRVAAYELLPACKELPSGCGGLGEIYEQSDSGAIYQISECWDVAQHWEKAS